MVERERRRNYSWSAEAIMTLVLLNTKMFVMQIFFFFIVLIKEFQQEYRHHVSYVISIERNTNKIKFYLSIKRRTLV